MSKEEYYSKIKRFFYRKFEELELVERNNGNFLYLRYKNKGYAEILIKKISGEVYYDYEFKDKFFKVINLEKVDFEILLGRWVEDTFQIKVNHTNQALFKKFLVVEDTFQIKVNHTPWPVQLSVEPLLKIPTK